MTTKACIGTRRARIYAAPLSNAAASSGDDIDAWSLRFVDGGSVLFFLIKKIVVVVVVVYARV